ncbi:aminotransferase class V-fold PLP-dependent enzyme [Deinococcus budaensis]|uniref:cysteine desulfurase n=1 Tax=Deinococcus budaensis TaxID=1665626 RepID=A0A7W8GEV2_9DEIO|nr:SufS family cysteine desulfurase [Deinococcus budaensis]MBB5233956.1 cysteine desulfurase/selenocysteine lyase [Deinococcus budaensis]
MTLPSPAPHGSPTLAGTLSAELRGDFPIFTHRPELAFLDSAASAQKPRQVIEAVAEFYAHDYANIHRGAYGLSMQATGRFEAVREKVARFFGAGSPDQVVFTRNATEAVNLVAYSWGLDRLRAGDVVLVSEMEHHANLVPWHLVTARVGARVEAVRMTPDGRLDLEDYAAKLARLPVRLVALQHVSNLLGTVHPARELVRLAHARGVPILLDGAQAAPHLPLDLTALGADFYVLSSHKMFGPTGVGALIAGPGRLGDLPPFLGGGDMIREVFATHSTYAGAPARFEAGTPAIAEVVGFGAALDYLDTVGMARLEGHERALLAYALEQLRPIEGLTLYGPALDSSDASGGGRSAVVSFNVRGAHAHDVASFLDEAHICVRAGHHCAQPLMRALGVPGTARASFSLYTTPAEIDRLASALREVAAFFAEEDGA